MLALSVQGGLLAQQRAVRIGQQVRAFNDSTRTVVSGRVVLFHREHLGIERSPGAGLTRLPWHDIHRLEAVVDGEWHDVPLTVVLDPDTAWTQGAIAGAEAADRVVAEYFASSTLLAVPIGYIGFCLFGDCELKYRMIPAAAVAGLLLTGTLARNRAERLVADLERYDFPDKSPGYTEAYRQAYERRLKARFNKQIVGGTLVGAVGGFGLLLYMLSGT